MTEALHHFIGHGGAPRSRVCYLAATGAHVTYMLRDTWEDTATGYFNVPREFLESAGITACDIDSNPYRAWVYSRSNWHVVISSPDSSTWRRLKIFAVAWQGYAYIARFEFAQKS